jgi:hypothetical protein
MIDEVITFIDTNLELCKTDYDFIDIMETCFSQYLVDKGYKYNIIINHKDINLNSINYKCASHNPYLIDQWINKKTVFAIKWKYCISYLNKNLVSQEFNYLTRFLYYGPYGTISKAELVNVFPKSFNFLYNKYNNINYLD